MNRRELMTAAFAASLTPYIPPAIAEVVHAEPVRDLMIRVMYRKDGLGELIVWQAENPKIRYYARAENVETLKHDAIKYYALFNMTNTECVGGTCYVKQSAWDAFRNHNDTCVVDNFGTFEALKAYEGKFVSRKWLNEVLKLDKIV